MVALMLYYRKEGMAGPTVERSPSQAATTMPGMEWEVFRCQGNGLRAKSS